jgi:hypothetical protein
MMATKVHRRHSTFNEDVPALTLAATTFYNAFADAASFASDSTSPTIVVEPATGAAPPPSNDDF